jgi:hypothetical protein
VKSPALLDVGATKLNETSPNVFAGITKLVIVGATLFTWNTAVVVAAKKFDVLA